MPTLLAVTAHPDDESFLFGGALAVHAAAGGRAGLLCLTDGSSARATGGVPRERLAAVRRQELECAVDVLGIPHLFAPGLPDGGLDAIGDERGIDLVRRVADEFGADVLLTFGPEGASGHPDHKACWRWTLAAAGDRAVYASTHPDGPAADGATARGGPPLPVTTVIDVSSLGDRKRRAFLCHRSQVDHLALFDRVLAVFAGREYYHRVRPAWRAGDPLELSLVPAG